MSKRCDRCSKRIVAPDALHEWLWEDERQSPKLCNDCYDFAVDQFEEGMTDDELEEILEDEL